MKFTGHERDFNNDPATTDDFDYMHVRYYSPLTERFLSVDPGKDWDPGAPQSWNLYGYVRNNPVNSKDPTGRCADPGGPGTRICIQTFIPMRTFGGFTGDARGAQVDGGSYRTAQSINVSSDDNRVMLAENFEPGTSEFGPLSRTAEVASHEVLPTSTGLVVSAAVSDGLLFGVAPNLEYNLLLAPAAEGGEMTVSGTHTLFPSLEVWVYQDGQEPQLIYVYDAPADDFDEGFIDINRLLKVPGGQHE